MRARSRCIASRSAFSTSRRCVSLAHVDEVVDDHAAQVAQAQLAGDLLGGLQVHLVGGLLGVVVGPEVAAVDVDGDQRLGLLDDDATRRCGSGDLLLLDAGDLVLDAVLVEQRLGARRRA